MEKNIYEFKAKGLKGDEINFSKYKSKVILIVNTASKCGFTYQYEGLEKLHKKYQEKGLTILGFPCNQFANQEPGNSDQISKGCLLNFGVSFQIFKKIDVNGKNAHPLFKYLKKQKKGIFRTQKIKWNFTKFLIDKDGKVVKRYAPIVKPEKIQKDIEILLKKINY